MLGINNRVISSNNKVKIEHSRKDNFLYYMCLLDWSGRILDETTHTTVAELIMPNGEWMNSWRVIEEEDEKLKKLGVEPKFLSGFYHSRIILRFKLTSCPQTLSEVRKIREAIEDFTEHYLTEWVFVKVREALDTCPRAFIYPVFELSHDCPILRVTGETPYMLPTTCFYTSLRDPEQMRWFFQESIRPRTIAQAFFTATVNMRISGAMIITSPMSKWFFWHLTNLIYHEGLYRQSRDKQIQIRIGEVYRGLEFRLADFADELMASFSQSVANVYQRILNRLLVSLTISIIALTVFLIVLNVIRN